MDQEQKFDKIIKKKVDEAEFPFDEQNWNKLSMQLDAERRLAASKGWGKFLFLGLLFLGVTSAGIALYKIQGPLGLKDKLAGNISSNENASSFAQAQSKDEVKEISHISNNKLTASNSGKENHAEKTIYSNNNKAEIESAISTEINNTDANKNAGTDSKLNSESNSETNSERTLSGANNRDKTVNQKRSKTNSLFTSGNSLSKNNGSMNVTDQNSNQTGGFELGASDKSMSEDVSGISLGHVALDRIDARIPILFSNRNVKLSTLKIPNWYEEDYHRKGKKRLSFLNAEAGGAYMAGWDSKDGKDGKGFNWYAGVNYGKFINRKIGFSIGAQFYNIGNIKQPFYESSKSVYGLGSTSSNTVITTQSLSYFSVPVKFYYAIKPAHQIGVGVNSSFLFSSKNIEENYRLTDNIRSNESKVQTSGIYEGVRLNNILVSAFYRVKINKRMFVNAEALYGVRDIFKNTNSNNYAQKPVGIRLGLQYTLFEK